MDGESAKYLTEMTRLVRPHIRRGRFELTDGQSTDWYVDGRSFMLSPKGSSLVGRRIAEMLSDDVRSIGGPVTAAIPVVAAVVHQSPVPRRGFYVRTEPRVHGLLRKIEGNLEPVVAIVDDTCATGGSIIRCIAAVEGAGSVVSQVIAVFDRDDGGERIRRMGYDYRYLLRLEDGRPLRSTTGPLS